MSTITLMIEVPDNVSAVEAVIENQLLTQAAHISDDWTLWIDGDYVEGREHAMPGPTA